MLISSLTLDDVMFLTKRIFVFYDCKYTYPLALVYRLLWFIFDSF